MESILGQSHPMLGHVKNFILHAVHVYHDCKSRWVCVSFPPHYIVFCSLEDLSFMDLSGLELKFHHTLSCAVCFQRSEENHPLTSCMYDAIRIGRDKKTDPVILNGSCMFE